MAGVTELNTLIEEMWVDYCKLNPNARRIYDLLKARGDTVQNDHIALRTFNHKRLGLKSLARTFEKYGYVEKDEYIFTEKKLYARHYEHADTSLPKIFISELEMEKIPTEIAEYLEQIIAQIPDSAIKDDRFIMSGRHWNISHAKFNELAEKSEYASWVSAHGFRPNHFTVFVNPLSSFPDLQTLNSFLKENGVKLNTSGGEIKGTPDVFLEQSSTMAENVKVKFSDGEFAIPGCYYEFARRYALPNGKLYQGFVAQSADKIFESTNKVR